MGKMARRTPQGVRGLKSNPVSTYTLDWSRTPQGVRGLKSFRNLVEAPAVIRRRTPQGVRGLKYGLRHAVPAGRKVAPRKGCVD